MKWAIKNGNLVAHGFFKVKFRASPSEISGLKVMAEHDNYGPLRLFRKKFFENKIRLRFVMLQTDNGNFTLDVKRDSGTSAAINWLIDIGWKIEDAVREATGTPLVRVVVSK